MLRRFTHHWKGIALRGLIAVAFGIIALFWPGLTVSLLLLLFGVYAVIDGIIAIWDGIRRHEARPNWWVSALQGLVGLVIGILMIFSPTRTVQVLIYAVAAWAIIVGFLQIILSYLLRREIANEWALALGGVVEIVVGIILLALPTTITAILKIIGIFALVIGALLILFAFRLRSIGQTHEQQIVEGGQRR